MDVTVLNLSPTGLCFAGPSKLTTGQEVSLRFTTTGDATVLYTATVKTRVQWCSASSRKNEPWSCGAMFQPMSLAQHLGLIRFFLEHFGLRFAGPGDKRLQVRLGFNKPVQVMVRIDSTRKTIEGEVKNLSVDGIGFICGERIDPGLKLTITLRAGSRESIPLRGIVVHSRKLAEGRFQVGVLTSLTSDADRTMLTEILVQAGHRSTEAGEPGDNAPRAPRVAESPSPAPTPRPSPPPPPAPRPEEPSDEDDDEPFTWGAPSRPTPAPARHEEEEDPLEAWARSVNLAPTPEPPRAAGSGRLLPGGGRERREGREGRAPQRPDDSDSRPPISAEHDSPTLQRLGPLVPPSRSAAEPVTRNAPSAPWPDEDVPPTMSLGSLVPTGSRGGSPPADRRPAERSRPPSPPLSRRDELGGSDPPTVQLGPLVPSQPSDRRPPTPPRTRDSAGSGSERDSQVRSWNTARPAPSPTGRSTPPPPPGEDADSAPPHRQPPSSPLPWRKEADPSLGEGSPSLSKRGGTTRPWSLTGRSTPPPRESDAPSREDSDDEDDPRQRRPGPESTEAPPTSRLFRHWRPGGGGPRST